MTTEKFDEAWYPGEGAIGTVADGAGERTLRHADAALFPKEARDTRSRPAGRHGGRLQPARRDLRRDPALTPDEAPAWLKRSGTRRDVLGLARYGIVAPRAFGVPISKLLALKKRIGKDRALAAALWKSGWYEARLLAAMVDDPKQVTRRQMDAWARAFDNWGVCDTVCWHLFDYTPFAFEKARVWSRSPREFVKRAGFALMAGQAGHNKTATDAKFLALLPLVEKGARDERNFVKKGVSWAPRRSYRSRDEASPRSAGGSPRRRTRPPAGSRCASALFPGGQRARRGRASSARAGRAAAGEEAGQEGASEGRSGRRAPAQPDARDRP